MAYFEPIGGWVWVWVPVPTPKGGQVGHSGPGALAGVPGKK
jgi:hypothetical protein